MSALVDLIRPPVAQTALARSLRHLSLRQLSELIQAAIDLLDAAGGDPDMEANGDELNGTTGEDDYGASAGTGTGCALADPPEDDDCDCCSAGDDRSTADALVPGVPLGRGHDDDDERSVQPLHLVGGNGA